MYCAQHWQIGRIESSVLLLLVLPTPSSLGGTVCNLCQSLMQPAVEAANPLAHHFVHLLRWYFPATTSNLSETAANHATTDCLCTYVQSSPVKPSSQSHEQYSPRSAGECTRTVPCGPQSISVAHAGGPDDDGPSRSNPPLRSANQLVPTL